MKILCLCVTFHENVFGIIKNYRTGKMLPKCNSRHFWLMASKMSAAEIIFCNNCWNFSIETQKEIENFLKHINFLLQIMNALLSALGQSFPKNFFLFWHSQRFLIKRCFIDRKKYSLLASTYRIKEFIQKCFAFPFTLIESTSYFLLAFLLWKMSLENVQEVFL